MTDSRLLHCSWPGIRAHLRDRSQHQSHAPSIFTSICTFKYMDRSTNFAPPRSPRPSAGVCWPAESSRLPPPRFRSRAAFPLARSPAFIAHGAPKRPPVDGLAWPAPAGIFRRGHNWSSRRTVRQTALSSAQLAEAWRLFDALTHGVSSSFTAVAVWAYNLRRWVHVVAGGHG